MTPGEPLWAAVVLDPPSRIKTVVPIHDAHVDDGQLLVDYPRALVDAGPRTTTRDALPWVEEERLRAHYGQRPMSADPTLVPISGRIDTCRPAAGPPARGCDNPLQRLTDQSVVVLLVLIGLIGLIG